MTKFEDQLFGQLMAEHGHQLRAVERPAQARRRVPRPVWLATGAAAAAASVTAVVMAVGSAPASAAYSVTQHDGTVSVSVYKASGVAGANAALQQATHPGGGRPRAARLSADRVAAASPPGPAPFGAGRERGGQERASLCLGQDKGRHPGRETR